VNDAKTVFVFEVCNELPIARKIKLLDIPFCIGAAEQILRFGCQRVQISQVQKFGAAVFSQVDAFSISCESRVPIPTFSFPDIPSGWSFVFSPVFASTSHKCASLIEISSFNKIFVSSGDQILRLPIRRPPVASASDPTSITWIHHPQIRILAGAPRGHVRDLIAARRHGPGKFPRLAVRQQRHVARGNVIAIQLVPLPPPISFAKKNVVTAVWMKPPAADGVRKKSKLRRSPPGISPE